MSNQGSYQPDDRRPLRSRETRWAHIATGWLVAMKASPNGISIAGMAAAVLAGGIFAATDWMAMPTSRWFWIVGAFLCQVRLLCNLFDGMVAIERGIASPVGELFNEVPDRVSDVSIMIGLGYAATGNSDLGYLAAITCVFVAYVRATGKSAGAENDFCGPMAKPQRMAIVTILGIFMALAPTDWSIIQIGPWQCGAASIALALVTVGGLATAIRRLIRAANHLKRAGH